MSEVRHEVEPIAAVMRLVERDGFLAAEVEADSTQPLTTSDVREALERLRLERS